MERRSNSLRKAKPDNTDKPKFRDDKKPFSKSGNKDDRKRDDKKTSGYGNVKKSYKKDAPPASEGGERKNYGAGRNNPTNNRPERTFKKEEGKAIEGAERRIYNKDKNASFKGKEKPADGTYFERRKSKFKNLDFDKNTKDIDDDSIRLNKFIANAGVCSRREADEMIAAGVVTVNGLVVTSLGTKVKRTDNVNYGGEGLKLEKNVYLLLNKPKDFITTMDDPEERKTVMYLVKNACKERIFPVGRLDRNTTGLLLFTNDGDLAKKLTHPKHGLKKIYHVLLDTDVAKEHLETLKKGVELEDGYAKADEIEYVGTGIDRKQIGVELHIGKNRIVRRMFEHFGYKVKTLDRVYFAGLTKKDLPRGRYRFLEPEEVRMLKMLG
jgi:23S rRNA pseudouridine2605 synthase